MVGADPTDVGSTKNLERVVEVLRAQVGHLQSENAALTAKIAELQNPPRSTDDFAAGMQHSLDVLQDRLATMGNSVSNFGVREFSLESKVHVDVTPLGTIGLRFVSPGEEVNAAALSTVSITVVPVPKPSADSVAAGTGTVDLSIDAIDGLSDDQVASLRRAHVTTVGSFQRIATRSTSTANLISLLGVDRDTLGRYTLLAGLLTVPGLDRLKAAVLYDAGITDVAALAQLKPAALGRRYATAAKRRKDDDGFRPSEEDAAAWIAAAQRLGDSAPP
jgi:hypothetical protein